MYTTTLRCLYLQDIKIIIINIFFTFVKEKNYVAFIKMFSCKSLQKNFISL